MSAERGNVSLVRVLIVDSFTDRPFGGNPAGVCLLDGPADPGWMQSLAAELRHSETAFLYPTPDGPADYHLRWFTPDVEVDLCGHGTLAAAHVLFADGRTEPVTFATRSGVLSAQPRPNGLVGLDFPAKELSEVDSEPGLADALGVAPIVTGRTGTNDVFAEVTDAAAVRDLTPDIAALGLFDARGVIVTAVADPGADHDFVSRFFAPRVGIAEDPVTGSAHCALAPYWSARLGRTDLVGVQLSARGGRIGVELRGERVMLVGRAVTVLDGTLAGH